MDFIEILKAILFGIVEGITEWLPISSTGHMIILDELVKLNVSDAFREMFLVVIQLGAILAVVVLYFKKLWPFSTKEKFFIKKDTFGMWFKILAACIPAAIVGVFFDDKINELFYNYQTVAAMLIIFGVLFIVIENYNKGRKPVMNSIAEITWKAAIGVGLFQLIAAVFPGTSRSGATILGGILLDTFPYDGSRIHLLPGRSRYGRSQPLEAGKIWPGLQRLRGCDPDRGHGGGLRGFHHRHQIPAELHPPERF